jgi:hypothetical protein
MSNTITHSVNRRVETESASLDQVSLSSTGKDLAHEQVHDVHLSTDQPKDLQETNFSRNGHRTVSVRDIKTGSDPATHTSVKTSTRHHVLPGVVAREKQEEVIDLKNCRGPAVPGLRSLAWKQYHGTVLDKFISYLADVLKLLELKLLGKLYARREVKISMKRLPKVVKTPTEEKEKDAGVTADTAGVPVKVKRRRKSMREEDRLSLDLGSEK